VREKRRRDPSRGRGVEEAQRGNVVGTRALKYEWGHGKVLTWFELLRALRGAAVERGRGPPPRRVLGAQRAQHFQNARPSRVIV